MRKLVWLIYIFVWRENFFIYFKIFLDFFIYKIDNILIYLKKKTLLKIIKLSWQNLLY